MNHDLTTTAPMLEGYQVIHNLGIVRGISYGVFGAPGEFTGPGGTAPPGPLHVRAPSAS